MSKSGMEGAQRSVQEGIDSDGDCLESGHICWTSVLCHRIKSHNSLTTIV